MLASTGGAALDRSPQGNGKPSSEHGQNKVSIAAPDKSPQEACANAGLSGSLGDRSRDLDATPCKGLGFRFFISGAVRRPYPNFWGSAEMYAVIQTGGKQYRVSEGDVLRVEKLAAEEGSTINFDVLMVADGDSVKVGQPIVAGGKVSATVESHGLGEKVKIIKFRRRKHHLKRQGHRQPYTALKITGITAG